ncbi:sel1 repeat family protein [Paraglaciecola sp. 20A4]|uniref:sel1 repeat family protein n=1 Tax=Paraglaciecola sp. 20A4 TaxID=2687288 RepID=UPI00140B092D|nr:sel1 repeat family protein [Paraglaciecola sp. 20A4]
MAWASAGHSDVIRYLPFLTSQVNTSEFPLHFLYRAYQAGDNQALARLSQRAITENNAYWLHFAKLAGSPQAQQYFSHVQVNNGRGKASRKALSYAAKRGDIDAQIALYHYWIAKSEPQKAQHWLEIAAQRDPASAVYYAKWLSISGNESQAIELLNRAVQLGSAHASRLLNMRVNSALVGQRKSESTALNRKRSATHCVQQLQFVASTLQSVLQADELIEQFKRDTRLQGLPICANTPIWLAENALTCSGNWQGEGRLGCDMIQLSQSLTRERFTHVVVLAHNGKANVHNGVMFLDRQDDYNVFVHELAHFSGFVDEYPLSSGLAMAICTGSDAPNLRLSNPNEKPDVHDWQNLLKGKALTISQSRTCDNHQAQAYKPSAKMTFMEFYDVPYIPAIYLRAWAERLANKSLLTPAYINFYQGFDASGNAEQGGYWRSRYQQFLQAD